MPVPRVHPTHWLISTQDVTKPRHAVEAVALAAPVAQHADDLGVLLAGLLEFELAFGLLVLILAAPPVLAALALILRHDLRVAASSASCEGDARVCKGSSGAHRRGGVEPLRAMRATTSTRYTGVRQRAIGRPPSALPGTRRATALCAFGNARPATHAARRRRPLPKKGEDWHNISSL